MSEKSCTFAAKYYKKRKYMFNFTPPIFYIAIFFIVVALVGSAYSLILYIRDRYKNRPAPSNGQRKAPAMPSYELSAWVDDEVVSRKLYRNPDLNDKRLAAELGLSLHQLERAISHASVYSVEEYLTLRRVQISCRLLRNHPDMSPEEVGVETGFHTYRDFRVAFARTMGMTPETYREQMHPLKTAK